MTDHGRKTLWEILWDYDPNGLIVVDTNMVVTVVNPAFCRMFETTPEEVIGKPASAVVGDVSDFQQVWAEGKDRHREGRNYPEHNLYVRQVFFPIPHEGITACIMVDLTHEWQQGSDMQKLRRQTIEKVNEVVHNQMKVAQEIAGLLGETTADTKVSLLKLIELVDRGIV